ncbi:hypothetical protein F383_36096 [Gossypium arboreum]|nr:hypothetical protein F383_36096 [Gossypium arboreum]
MITGLSPEGICASD